MHPGDIEALRHEHVFLGAHHDRHERQTRAVIALSLTAMVAEIVCGALFRSMGLISEGLHMATHAGVLTVAALAYAYARRHARDPRFSFGLGKLGDLAAFGSAVVLAIVALLIAWESVQRLFHPVRPNFDDALVVAVIGLGVSVLSAWLLHDNGHAHEHGEAHAHNHHRHGRGHEDLNLRAAYLHMLTDALVGLLAIVGLTAGRQFGWLWSDPLMGLVGASVVAQFAWTLARSAGRVLLDVTGDPDLARAIRERLASDTDELVELHLWRVGPGHFAAIASIASSRPMAPSDYRTRLEGLTPLSHVTIEVHPVGATPERE